MKTKTLKKLLGWGILVGMFSTFIGTLMQAIGIIPVLKVLGFFGATLGLVGLIALAGMLIEGTL